MDLMKLAIVLPASKSRPGHVPSARLKEMSTVNLAHVSGAPITMPEILPDISARLTQPPHKHHTTTSPRRQKQPHLSVPAAKESPRILPLQIIPPTETYPSCSPEAPSFRPPSTSRVCCLTLTARSTRTNVLLNDLMTACISRNSFVRVNARPQKSTQPPPE
ncbi:hypothetical protein K456DRAFT_41376 [Colletotrichum gloeosporioides 23]|nr:hypothetical protein K456DRAFT_41376 [Colletotrichum gloeosporioides 23]